MAVERPTRIAPALEVAGRRYGCAHGQISRTCRRALGGHEVDPLHGREVLVGSATALTCVHALQSITGAPCFITVPSPYLHRLFTRRRVAGRTATCWWSKLADDPNSPSNERRGWSKRGRNVSGVSGVSGVTALDVLRGNLQLCVVCGVRDECERPLSSESPLLRTVVAWYSQLL